MSIPQPHQYETEATSDAQILVIEDERPIRQFLRASLVSHGYRVTEVDTGSAGVKHALTYAPDIIILDLGLPDMDGIEVIRTIRNSSPVPILVTSARDRSIGAVASLNAGANDYLRKPFITDDLLNRIDALIRFVRRSIDVDNEDFVVDHLRVVSEQKRVFIDDREIQLSPAEYGILHSLIVHAGGVVTLEQLSKELGSSLDLIDELRIRTGMIQLRRKIEGDAILPRYLLAEPGIGYRLAVN